MPQFKGAYASLPASDFERAKSWWADKVGLKPEDEFEAGAYYKVAGTRFLLYPSQFAGTNKATAMTIEVPDIRAAVDEMRSNGIEFQEYDLPELKTEAGVATWEEGGKKVEGAWFIDSEGNIIALGTPTGLDI